MVGRRIVVGTFSHMSDSEDEREALAAQLAALKADISQLAAGNAPPEITEAYTSDEERVDRIRRQGPSIVAPPDRCNRCGSTPASCVLLRCSKCKVAHYCTKGCQRDDWVYHKKWCASFVRSGVDVRKALWKPLTREAVLQHSGAPKAPRTSLKHARAPAAEAAEEADATPTPPCADCCDAKGTGTPPARRKKSVRFAADATEEKEGRAGAAASEGGEEDEEEESAVEMGSFTVVPPGADAWMQALMHDPFEVRGGPAFPNVA